MNTVSPRTICYIIEYAHRERIRLLENHADSLSQLVNVYLSIDIFAVELHRACYPASLNEVVHAVQRLKKRRLAASGRPYKCCDFFFLYVKVYVLQSFEITVKKLQILDRVFIHIATSSRVSLL